MNASAGLAWDAQPQQEMDELQVWMESLASGQWSADDLLREVLRLEKHDPGLPWDVLTTLEQYYHRERISHQLFICVRSRLQKHLDSSEQMQSPVPAEDLPAEVSAELSAEADGTAGVLHAGDLIRGRYRVVEILDRNAWGTQVEAVDEHRLDLADVRTRVSMHVFDLVRAQEVQLLQRAYRLQSLSHPCIQKVFDVDDCNGGLFVTLEWLGGISIQQLLDLNGGRPLAMPAARAVVRSVASALAYAHGRDVQHGAIDAGCVVVTDAGEIKLRGFELTGFHRRGDPSSDRLAFAKFAYRLFGGGALPDDCLGPRARRAALRQPPGLSRAEWGVLRDVLLGRDSPALLMAFAGEGDVAGGRYTLTQALPVEHPRRRAPAWLAAGAALACVIAAGVFFIEPFGTGASGAGTPTAPAIVAASQPPAAPSAPVIGSATAAQPAASTPVAARRVLPIEPQQARVELTASTVEASASEPFARIQVRRRDNLDVPVSFRWWTETGSAHANRDFLGIEPRLEWIPVGAKGVELRVPLLSDPSRNEPRDFYVKIEMAGSKEAVLGNRTLTQVSIRPSGATTQQAAVHPGPVTVAALP